LPWPDIDPAIYTGLIQAVSWLWSFNEVMPIDTLFVMGAIGIGIEFGLFISKILSFIHSLVTGRNRPRGSI